MEPITAQKLLIASFGRWKYELYLSKDEPPKEQWTFYWHGHKLN